LGGKHGKPLFFENGKKKKQDIWQQKKDVNLQQLVLQELIDPIAQHFHRCCRSSDGGFSPLEGSWTWAEPRSLEWWMDGVSVEIDGSTTP